MDYRALLNFAIPEVRQSYRGRDAVLYALSVCAGHWAERPRGLAPFVEERGPVVLPSFAVDLGHPGFWLGNPAATVNARKVLHAEESFRVTGPLPPNADVIGRTRIVDVVDKGAEKGALLYLRKEVTDASTGQVIAEIDRCVMLRGDGGYEGPSGPPRAAPVFPASSPKLTVVVATSPDQAFLYRLNGDPNPLHVDPETARGAGFDRPILHGLCTFGIAATAAFYELAGGDPSRFQGFRARFSAPVFPGERLRIDLWASGAVRVHSVERGIAVLTHGQADFLPPSDLKDAHGYLRQP